MDSPYEKELADEWGPADAVTTFQIKSFLNMANAGRNDVLYDLGSGHGRVVRLAVTHSKVKRAIGIEHEPERFCHARQLAKRKLTNKELEKVDFLMAEMEEVKLTGVTVVYYGLEITIDTEKMLKKLLGQRKVRIIFKDLPLLGYAPTASSRDSSTTWFFLVPYPFKHRIRDRDDWARSFLGPNATISSVFKYYDSHLKRRELTDRVQSVNALRRNVGKTFRKLH